MGRTIWRGFFGLKLVSRALLYAEVLDVTTTLGGIGLMPQLWEANPLYTLLGGWGATLLAKVLATLVVVLVLELVDEWPALVGVVPLAATLPGLWNLAAILAEIFAR